VDEAGRAERVEGLAVALVLLAAGASVAAAAAVDGESPAGTTFGFLLIFLAFLGLMRHQDDIKNS